MTPATETTGAPSWKRCSVYGAASVAAAGASSPGLAHDHGLLLAPGAVGAHGAGGLEHQRIPDLERAGSELGRCRARAAGRPGESVECSLLEQQELVECALRRVGRRQAEPRERLELVATARERAQRGVRPGDEGRVGLALELAAHGVDEAGALVGSGARRVQPSRAVARPLGGGRAAARHHRDGVAGPGQPAHGGDDGALLAVGDEDSRGHPSHRSSRPERA